MEDLLSKVAPYAAILVTCQICSLLRGSGLRIWTKEVTSGILNEVLEGNEVFLPWSVVSCSDLISCQSKMKRTRESETAPGEGAVQGRESGSEGSQAHSPEGREHERTTPALILRVPHQPSGQRSVCMNSHSPWSLPVRECTLNMAGTLKFPQYVNVTMDLGGSSWWAGPYPSLISVCSVLELPGPRVLAPIGTADFALRHGYCPSCSQRRNQEPLTSSFHFSAY